MNVDAGNLIGADVVVAAPERGASPAVTSRANRLARFAAPAVAAAIVLCVALGAIDNFPVGVVQDDGMYTILAKSLATGHGYRWLNVPGAPPATHYPPGYPLFLALVWRFGPDFPANVVVFKALNALLLAAATAFVVVLARRQFGLSERVACLAGVVGGAAIPTLVLSTLVMSEMLFLALLVPALLYAERIVGAGRAARGDAAPVSVRSAISLGLAAGALMLVRTHGVAFAGAVALTLLVARQWRAVAAFLAAAVAVILPWQLWQMAYRASVAEPLRGAYESYGGWLWSGTHGSPLVLAARTIAGTSRELFATIAAMTTAGVPTLPLRAIAAVAAIALLAAGLASSFVRARVTACFVALYVGIVLLWPFTPGRFLWGIWPVIMLLFMAGVIEVVRSRPRALALKVGRVAVACCAILIAIGYGTYSVRGYRGRWWSSIPRTVTPLVVPAILWVNDHTKPTDVVAGVDEPMIYLYTGRLSVPASRFSADDYFAAPTVAERAAALSVILRAYPVDVVAIVANDSLEAAARRLAALRPPMLAVRDSVPRALIFSSLVR